MTKLALPVASNVALHRDEMEIAISSDVAPSILPEFGETVLLYTVLAAGILMFVGRARLVGLRLRDGGQLRCQLTETTQFVVPVPGDAEAATPAVTSLLRLDAARFDAILEEGQGAGAAALFAHEAASAFELVEDTYLSIHDQVLQRWDYRCAVTGNRVTPGPRPHPQMRVVAIRPRELGGPLHARNFLPLQPDAEQAWINGIISVGPQLDIVVVLDRLPAELLERLRPEGRLLVPDNPDQGPDPEHLAFHRVHIFGA